MLYIVYTESAHKLNVKVMQTSVRGSISATCVRFIYIQFFRSLTSDRDKRQLCGNK